MNLFYQPLLKDGVDYLSEEESRHCVKVLRHRNGESIRITDGSGFFYTATIIKADPSRTQIKIVDQQAERTRDFEIHIAISPTKNADRIEWFVEKATELGIDKVTLLNTEHTERSFIKQDRLEKVAVSAMKQSLKATVPKINALTSFDTFISSIGDLHKFIAYVDESNPLHLMQAASPHQRYVVLIGPEGDFSPTELQEAVGRGFVKVSLGTARLRTETAGVAACHILNLINT